ncbi:hypothetical protein PV04_06301 [Phialophora macrospora]|uniref:Uncharacterized protein n=1 Tax=Phialophora macrospora TaxID=1851006 RepID=A0A0D2FG56_9EURO|nr:hypothetical protein PV04_06301 [Phialophora macrospora]
MFACTMVLRCAEGDRWWNVTRGTISEPGLMQHAACGLCDIVRDDQFACLLLYAWSWCTQYVVDFMEPCRDETPVPFAQLQMVRLARDTLHRTAHSCCTRGSGSWHFPETTINQLHHLKEFFVSIRVSRPHLRHQSFRAAPGEELVCLPWPIARSITRDAFSDRIATREMWAGKYTRGGVRGTHAIRRPRDIQKRRTAPRRKPGGMTTWSTSRRYLFPEWQKLGVVYA